MLCLWQVQVSVYCVWRIPAHLRCTQCSILLHLMEICFLHCICLWQISHIQTCLCVVVGPGFVSTSPAFMRSSASHPAGPHGRLAQKTVNQAPLMGAGGFTTICTAVCNRYDSSTTCRLCRLVPLNCICHLFDQSSNLSRSACNIAPFSSLLYGTYDLSIISKLQHLPGYIQINVIYIYIRNKHGSNTDSCGTPFNTGSQSDVPPFMITRCFLSVIHLLIHAKTTPSMP